MRKLFRSRPVHANMARGFVPRAQPHGTPLIRSDMVSLEVDDFQERRHASDLPSPAVRRLEAEFAVQAMVRSLVGAGFVMPQG